MRRLSLLGANGEIGNIVACYSQSSLSASVRGGMPEANTANTALRPSMTTVSRNFHASASSGFGLRCSVSAVSSRISAGYRLIFRLCWISTAWKAALQAFVRHVAALPVKALGLDGELAHCRGWSQDRHRG